MANPIILAKLPWLVSVGLGYMRDDILPMASYIGILTSHCKNAYQTTSLIRSNSNISPVSLPKCPGPAHANPAHVSKVL